MTASQSLQSQHRRALAKIAQLQSLANAMGAPRPLVSVLELVIDQIFDIVPADAAAVWRYDAETDCWYIGGSKGLSRRASEVRFRSGQTLHSKIGDEGVIVDDLAAAGFRRLYAEHELIQSALYAPMSIAGKRVGLLALYRNTEQAFTKDDLEFVRAVGAHVGMAVSFAVLEARGERLAVLEERSRLGAGLHDGVLQILSSINVYVTELRRTLESLPNLDRESAAALGEIIRQLEDCVGTGSREVTAAIALLREPQFKVDVVQWLESTGKRLRAAGVDTSVTCAIDDVSIESADALCWIAHEAASNIIKHSAARHVAIDARSAGPAIEMTIRDDGVGLEWGGAAIGDHGGHHHLGRRIMQERAEQIGGRLSIESSPAGTCLQVKVPIAP